MPPLIRGKLRIVADVEGSIRPNAPPNVRQFPKPTAMHPFLLDSGSQPNTIKASVLKALGLPRYKIGLEGTAWGNPVTITGYTRVIAEVFDSDGNLRRTPLTLLETSDDAPEDFVLGMAFHALRNPRYDAPNGKFYWEAKKQSQTRDRRRRVLRPSQRRHLARILSRPDVMITNNVIGPAELVVPLEEKIALAAMTLEPNSSAPQPNSPPNYMANIPPEYKEFSDVFADPDSTMLPIRGLHDHAIDLEPGRAPPFGKLYPMSPSELDTLKEYLDRLLDAGLVRKSTSAAASPVMFVPKNDGSLRLVVDYRGLNDITIKNRYPLPLISDMLDRLKGAQLFTKLDCKDAYNRIRIREGDEWKTAFRTRFGLFEYLVMPFGLTNAPATFQAYIDKALREHLDVICVVYLDDVLIFSKNPTEHTGHVRQVLQSLREHGLHLKPSKCAFHVTEVDFLGLKINTEGIFMDQSRIRAVEEWPVPQNLRELQGFLGFTNFFRRLIEGYSRRALPLLQMLKTKTPKPPSNGYLPNGTNTQPNSSAPPIGSFPLNEEALEAFQDLKKMFTEAPILQHFDETKPIRIETDASQFALGGILTQPFERSDGIHWMPVAYHSRKLHDTETRYGTGEQELLAIVDSLYHWRHYCRGAKHPITILTDHANLVWFMTCSKLTRRQLKWAERLSEYQLSIRYREGKKNPADGLSRRPDYELPSPKQTSTAAEHTRRCFREGSSIYQPVQARLELQALQLNNTKRRTRSSANEPNRPNEQSTRNSADDDQDNPRLLQGAEGYETSQVQPGIDPEEIEALEEDSAEHAEALRLVSSRLPLGGERTAYTGMTDEQLAHAIEDEQSNDELAGFVRQGLATLESNHRLAGEVDPTGDRPPQENPELLMDPHWTAETTDCMEDRERAEPPTATTTGETEERPNEGRIRKVLLKQWRLEDKLLYYRERLYVPMRHGLRTAVIGRYHDELLAGHWDKRRTTELVRRTFDWPGLYRDVRRYCHECIECQKAKPARHKPRGFLRPLPVPSRPWETVTIDFITDLPPSRTYNGPAWNSILVITDKFSKMAHYVPTKRKMSVTELIEVFMREVVRLHGFPANIVSDRDRLFTAAQWKRWIYYMRMRSKMSTAYHPQTDGQTERQNQSIEAYLRIFVNDLQSDWATLLPCAEFAYNNSKHSATGYTPFELNQGWNPMTGLDAAARRTHAERSRTQMNLQPQHLQEHHWLITQYAKDYLEEANRKYAFYYNQKRAEPLRFKNGDLVLLNGKDIAVDKPTKKIHWKKLGPYKVLKEVSDGAAYELDIPKERSIYNVFNAALLEPFHEGRTVPPNMYREDLINLREDEWDVSEILDSKVEDQTLYFLIKWGNGDDPSWESHELCSGAKGAIRDFTRKNPTKPRPGPRGTIITRTTSAKRGRGRPRK
jgi:Reverse transcriptase (RNA-dependent DNA polymerase)/RNase H-like domain found in reverse transcriptase/Integrase zinc binding domain